MSLVYVENMEPTARGPLLLTWINIYLRKYK